MAEENQVINSEAYLKKLGGLYGKVTNRIKKMEAAMKTADSFAAATTKLNALNSGLEQQEALQASVYRAAQRTRSAFSDFANVVSTLGTAAPNAFEDSSGLVSFAETVRKAIALSGADAAGQAKVVEALGQAMSTGSLSGEGAAVLETYAAPLAQAITGGFGGGAELKELAAQGLVTAEVIRTSMGEVAGGINSQFSQLPMTFSQMGTAAQNLLGLTLGPLLQVLGSGVTSLMQNWEQVGPALLSVAAGAAVLAAGLSLMALKEKLAAVEFAGLSRNLLRSPLTWVALIVGAIIAAMFTWSEVAQLVGEVVGGVFATIYNIVAFVANVILGTAFAIYATVWGFILGILQLVAMAATEIAKVLDAVFGTNLTQGAKGFANTVENMMAEMKNMEPIQLEYMDIGESARQGGQAALDFTEGFKNAMGGFSLNEGMGTFDLSGISEQPNEMEVIYGGMDPETYGVDGGLDVNHVESLGRVENDVSVAKEDLDLMRDVAEMRFLQNFVSLTPTVTLNARVDRQVDVDAMLRTIESKLEEEILMSAEGAYL